MPLIRSLNMHLPSHLLGSTPSGEQSPMVVFASLVSSAIERGKTADIHGVVALLQERVAMQEHIDLEIAERRECAAVLTSVGRNFFTLGKQADAEVAIAEAHRLLIGARAPDQLAHCLELRAHLAHDSGDLVGAMNLLRRAETIRRQQNQQAELQRLLETHARYMIDDGDLEHAIVLVAEHARICRELRDRDSLLKNLLLQTVLLMEQADLQGVLAVLDEQERLQQENERDGSPPLEVRTTAFYLVNRGLVLLLQHEIDTAEPLIERAAQMLSEVNDKGALAKAISVRALAAQHRGDLDFAFRLRNKAVTLYREADDPSGLAKELALQAHVLAEMGRKAASVASFEEANSLARRYGLRGLMRDSFLGVDTQMTVGQPNVPISNGALRLGDGHQSDSSTCIEHPKRAPLWKRFVLKLRSRRTS
ncbi:MAG: hypothetical protein JXA30_14165 [Deltaproteobacteria bacterium]|nr:hypothetical protein [Deltaproteobacteria bacterium]